MFNLKIIVAFSIVLSLTITDAQRIVPVTFPLLNPDKCTDDEATIYVMEDNKFCCLYRNPCYFLLEQRRRPDVKFTVVTKDECLGKCIETCAENDELICAEYRDQHFNFGNLCQMYQASCKEDKSYRFHYYNLCLHH